MQADTICGYLFAKGDQIQDGEATESKWTFHTINAVIRKYSFFRSTNKEDEKNLEKTVK